MVTPASACVVPVIIDVKPMAQANCPSMLAMIRLMYDVWFSTTNACTMRVRDAEKSVYNVCSGMTATVSHYYSRDPQYSFTKLLLRSSHSSNRRVVCPRCRGTRNIHLVSWSRRAPVAGPVFLFLPMQLRTPFWRESYAWLLTPMRSIGCEVSAAPS